MEYYLAIKKKEVMPFAATQMDLEIITLSDGSQTETNTKQFSYTWNPKYDTNELIYETKKKNSDIENRFVVAKEEGKWEGDGLRVWD